MKRKSELTEKERLEAAEKRLLTSLSKMNFYITKLADFFTCMYEVRKTHRELIDAIEGGWRYSDYPNIEDYIVGEVPGYYIVNWKEFTADTKVMSQKKHRQTGIRRQIMVVSTGIMTLSLRGVGRGEEYKYKKLGGPIDLTKEKEKKVIKESIIEIFAGGKRVEEKDKESFYEAVRYWRNFLETLRVELHLAGKPSYNYELEQVDTFIQILEK